MYHIYFNMTWKNEKARHSLSARGIKTKGDMNVVTLYIEKRERDLAQEKQKIYREEKTFIRNKLKKLPMVEKIIGLKLTSYGKPTGIEVTIRTDKGTIWLYENTVEEIITKLKTEYNNK